MTFNLLHPLITTSDVHMSDDTSAALMWLLIITVIFSVLIIICVAVITKDTRKPARIIVKYFLIIGITVFSLWDYRLFTFENGVSKNYWGGEGFEKAISVVVDIQRVEYYKKTISNDKNIYKVFIETSTDNHILDATEEDIKAFSVLGYFSENIKPKKITPIPFYVEAIIIVVLLFIPTRLKKSEKSKEDSTKTEKIKKIY